jgi:hypothetical protein
VFGTPARRGELVEQHSPFPVRQQAGRAAVEMQHVEDLMHHRLSVSRATCEAPAETLKVWPPVVAQAHQFAVERHPTLAQRLPDRVQLEETVRAGTSP